MKKVVFTVEFGKDNLSGFSEDASLPDFPSSIAVTADNLAELKEEAKEALLFHIESCKEDGDPLPDFLEKGEYEVSLVVDTQSFLQYYGNVLTRSALSRITGINERQLGHYIQGRHKPRKDKAKKIEESLHKIGKELLAVELV